VKQFTSMCYRVIFALLVAAAGTPSSAALSLDPSERQLIQTACQHEVVILGENSHGDGRTIAVRAKLIPELVRRCGFNTLAFEASFYDFAELADTTARDAHYDRSKFLSAVGLLWARDAEFAPLADWVAKQTPRTLHLVGMDIQIGAAGAFYSLEAMPTAISNAIPPKDRETCRETMIGFITWSVDRSSAQGEVDCCLSLALRGLAGRRSAEAVKLSTLARAFRTTATWTRMKPDKMIAARDAAMADKLQAFRRQLGPGAKIIVWTANAHAALGGYTVGRPLGQITRARIGSALLSVGFSAAGGDFRWSKSETHRVRTAASGSLEQTILDGRTAAFADKTKLTRVGRVSGTAFDWHKPLVANWSDLFDAIYVIEREEPTTLLSVP
jgi:erythromycin esterase-like protein